MNEFKFKNGLIINDTQAITGVTNTSGLTNNASSVSTVSAIKQYIDSKLVTGGGNTTVIYNSGGTLSGTTNMTFDRTSLYVNNNINTTWGGMTNLGGFYINLINGTGAPSVKGKLVTYKTNPEFNSNITSIDVQSDGKIIVGGTFTKLGELLQNYLTALNLDGTKASGFTIGYGFDYSIACLKVLSDDTILVGGGFINYDIYPYYHFIKLNSNGTVDSTFNVGDGSYIFSPFYGFPIDIDVQSNDNIIAVGQFDAYSGATHKKILMLNPNGTINSGFNVGTGANWQIRCVKVQPDDRILIGGDFTMFGGTSKQHLNRILSDGSNDSTFTIGTGFSDNVYDINIQSDGSVIAVGSFTQYDGNNRNYIVKMDSGGTIDSGFVIGSGFNGYAFCVAVQTDDRILVGGYFDKYSGVTQNFITRLNIDGTIDSSFTIGTGFDYYVYSIKIQPDGKILVGGNFTSYNGKTAKYITRLNIDGTMDDTFNAREDLAFKYFPTGQDNKTIPYVGVVVDSGVPSGQSCKIAVNGVCDVLICSSSDPVSIGDIISSYVSVNDGDLGYTNPALSPQWIMGRALENGVAGDIIKCLILSKDVQSI